MAVQLASAYMQIIPSMKGFQGTVTKELVGVEKEGVSSGTRLGTGMAGGVRSRLLSALPGAGANVGNMFGGGLLGTIRRYAGPITGVVAGLLSVEGIKKSMETFEATAASTRTLQRVIGGSAQSVSGFVGAMQLAGVSSDKAGGGIRIFSKNVGLAAGDSKKATKLTQELGFSFKNAHGAVLPMSDLLPKVADRFKSMPDGAQKTALAMQLFGKSGTQMLPFLNKGSAGIAELTGKAKSMGLVIDDTSMKIFAASRTSLREFHASMQGASVAAGQDFTVALDGLANIGRAVLIPVFGAMGRVFTALRPQFTAIGEAADRIAVKLGAQLAPIVNRLAGQFIAFVQKADIGKWAETVSGWLEKIVSGLGRVGGGNIVSSIGGIAQSFSPLQAILKAIEPILPRIVSALAGAATTVGPILATLATNVVSFITPLITSRQGILLLVGAFVGFKVVSGIISAIAVAARIATLAQVAWNIAMSANPIGIIIVAVAALVAGLIWFFTQTDLGRQVWANFIGFLVQAWTNIVNVAQTVWGAIAGAVGTAINTVRTVVTTVVGAIVTVWNAYWARLGAVVRTVFGAIAGFIGPIINGIRTVITNVVGTIVTAWNRYWQLLSTGVRIVWAVITNFIKLAIFNVRVTITNVVGTIVTAWNRYWNLILTGIRIVWGLVVNFIKLAIFNVRVTITNVVGTIVSNWNRAWNTILTAIRVVWATIVNFIKLAIFNVRVTITNVVGTIVSNWNRAWNTVVNFLKTAWSQITTAVSNGVKGVIGFVTGLGTSIVNAVSGFGSLLFNSGKALIQGFIDGIKNMFGTVKKVASDIVGTIANFFPHSPAKEGPFSGRGWTLYSGHSLVEGFAEGMNARTGLVRSAASGVTTAARPSLGTYRTPSIATASTAGLGVARNGFPAKVTLVDSKDSILGHMDVRIDQYDLSQQLQAAR